MRTLRVGTRGSELALRQTRLVCARLRTLHPNLEIEEIVIQTHGDEHPESPVDGDWPAGGFVGAIERALLDQTVDFAVHSYKDLPAAPTPGLAVVAVPHREAVHDVLVLREPVDITRLPRGFRIGTGSPRRAAQWRRSAPVEIVPLRGNVPTRLVKMEREGLDGVVLAAAGLKRLEIQPPHAVDLSLDAFLPAPAQGALAVQARRDDEVAALLTPLEDPAARVRVEAERALLATVGPGCRTPFAALATLEGPGRVVTLPEDVQDATGEGTPQDQTVLHLRAQWFAEEDETLMVALDRSTTITMEGRIEEAIREARRLGRALGVELAARIKALASRGPAEGKS